MADGAGEVGKKKTTRMKIMNETAAVANGALWESQCSGTSTRNHSVFTRVTGFGKTTDGELTKRPKRKGPGLKLFLPRKRAEIGIEYATY